MACHDLNDYLISLTFAMFSFLFFLKMRTLSRIARNSMLKINTLFPCISK